MVDGASGSPITVRADHIVAMAAQTEICHRGPLYNVTQNHTTHDWWYYNHYNHGRSVQATTLVDISSKLDTTR